MIRFCSSGTVAAPISTPRSPRATITASASSSTSSSASTASAFSIFAITRAGEPCWRMIACRSRTSAAARTNESATKSTPSPSANSRSSRSFFVSDGIGTGTPGRLTPLCDLTSPPTTTRQRARPCSTSWTASRTRPSSIRMSWPGRSTSPITAGAIGSSPFSACCSPTTTISSSLSRMRGSSRSPMRSFGPWRSAISASGLPVSSWTSRTTPALAAWSSCVPCERLRRIASTPGLDELAENVVARRHRPDRRDDLGSPALRCHLAPA